MTPRYYPVLAAAIAARGLTYQEVAAMLGISTSAVGHIVRGSLRPSSALRERFAETFGVDVDVLFEPHADVVRLLETAEAHGLDHLFMRAGSAGLT